MSVKLAAEAEARRWHDAPERAVLGDGATWIWNIAEREYAQAAHDVDWYHTAKEHLYAAAEVAFPNRPDQSHAWVDQQADQLYAGQARHIADQLRVLAARANPEARAQLESEAGYFTHNHERMQYHDFQQAGLPIGSGTIESGANRLTPPVHLVGHSLGGLMLLRLFDLAPAQPPGRVVLLGSPVTGSHAARSVAGWAIGPSLLGRLALEEIVERGPRRWTQPRELGVIAGSTSAGLGRLVSDLPEPNDGTVAVEETRIEGMTDHLVLPVTHTGMLFSQEVATAIGAFLRDGRFAS